MLMRVMRIQVLSVKFVFLFSVSADIENIDDGLESLCLSVTEHALSGESLAFFSV